MIVGFGRPKSRRLALSRPKGTFPITGSVTGSKIRFGAVGAGATYTGSASDSSMSGSYKTAQGGGTWNDVWSERPRLG